MNLLNQTIINKFFYFICVIFIMVTLSVSCRKVLDRINYFTYFQLHIDGGKKNVSKAYAFYYSGNNTNAISITANFDQGHSIEFHLADSTGIKQGIYKLSDVGLYYQNNYAYARYHIYVDKKHSYDYFTDSINEGTLTISKIDVSKKIFSGYFSFQIQLKDGINVSYPHFDGSITDMKFK